MRSLLTCRLKRPLICILLRPWGFTSRAWLMRRAVGSMGAVSRRGGHRAAVIPHGQSGLKMAGFDGQAAIEGSVDGTEAQNLSFGPAGGGAVYVRTPLTQMRIVMVPCFLSLWVAMEDDRGLGVDPVLLGGFRRSSFYAACFALAGGDGRARPAVSRHSR
jgi:hypothetical protein